MTSQKLLLSVCGVVLAFAAAPVSVAAEGDVKLIDEFCAACHTAKQRPIDKMHLTRDQWAEAVERMAGYGVEVPKAKLPQLLDYLASAQGPATDGVKK